MGKIPKALWAGCRATEERRTRIHTYADLALPLTELALDLQQELHFEGIFKWGIDSNPQRFTHRQNAQLKLIKNCTLFHCQGNNDKGEPMRSEDCTCQESYLLVKGKKQENHLTKDGQKEKMPDHFRFTVTSFVEVCLFFSCMFFRLIFRTFRLIFVRLILKTAPALANIIC